MDYGFARGEAVTMLKTTADNRKAWDRGPYTLGLSLAQFVVRTEFLVAKAAFQAQNPYTGVVETMDVGLPFTW